MKLARVIIFISLAVVACLLSACGDDGSSSADGSWKNSSALVDNARYPLIGSDGNGNMTTVWVQPDGIYSAYFDSQLGWGAPLRIAERTASYINFRDIHLAVNAKGDAVVAWVHEGDSANYFIQTVKYTAGSGWSAPQQLTPPNTVFSLDLALDANSTAMIAWTGWDFPVARRNVFASRSMQSSGWDAPQPIGTNTWDAQYPRIAVDGAGNAFVFWAEGEFASNNVYVNHYTVDSGWSTPQHIAANTGSALWTNISFDKTGNAMAVWAQQDSTTRTHIYSCRYVAGNGWGSAVIIDSNTLDSTEPALTMESSGVFRAVWVQFTGTGSDVYSSRTTASNGWETPLLIGSGGFANSPRVAADGIGNVFTAWQQHDPNDIFAGDAKVYANHFKAGSGWSSQSQLKNALGSADAPEIAVDPQGHATVIWSQSVGSIPPGSIQYGIFASRYQ